MKKVLSLAAVLVLSTLTLSAGTLLQTPATQTHAITLNGKPFAQGVILQGGIIAVSLEDFARAAGAPITLEPQFQLQGNRLYARSISSGGDYKEGQIKFDAAAAAPAIKYGAVQAKQRVAGQIIAVRQGGLISANVMMVNGKAFIPLKDIVNAFGDGSVRGFTGGVKPGEAINLNSASNTRGILVGL